MSGPCLGAFTHIPIGVAWLDDATAFWQQDFGLKIPSCIEIIEYPRVEGEDLYPCAKPPTTGILHMHNRVPDLKPIRERLAKAKAPVTDHGAVNAIFGGGTTITFRSPAGFRSEVQA